METFGAEQPMDQPDCHLDHTVCIVPDRLQTEDIVIGYDIIGKPDIVGKISQGKWWFYPRTPEERETRSSKVTLCAAKTSVIPPHLFVCCKLEVPAGNMDNDQPIFVEGGPRSPDMFIPNAMVL